MSFRPRTPLLLLVALFALVAAGCGGGGSEADSSTDVNQLLEQTFSGKKKVDSGRFDLKLRFEPQGGDTGPVSISLAGPFQKGEDGKLPRFSMEAAVEGGGQNIKAGLTSTGDKGFVSFQGTNYAVSDPVFKSFAASYEEARKQAAQNSGADQASLASLGIDPRRWLKDAKNAGEAKVGDADTIRITGGVDVPKLLDDLNGALERARTLGVQGTEQIPEKLTDEQRSQVTEAVKDLKVEIFTGKEDKTLRRMIIDLNIQVPEGAAAQAGAQAGAIKLDFSILELNEEQEISAPADPKPFEELLSQLGGLGLGGLGGTGSGSGSEGAAGGGASAEDLEQYSQCIEDAGQDAAKVSECANLLAP